MAIKHTASCIDTAIYTTLLTLCHLEREIFFSLPWFWWSVGVGGLKNENFQNQKVSLNCSVSFLDLLSFQEVSWTLHCRDLFVYFTLTWGKKVCWCIIKCSGTCKGTNKLSAYVITSWHARRDWKNKVKMLLLFFFIKYCTQLIIDTVQYLSSLTCTDTVQY